MPYYVNPVNYGLIEAEASNDGYSITVNYYKAYPSVRTNKIAYNIFYSTDKTTVFSKGVKFVVPDTTTSVTISDLTPGQLYHFGLRAVEYDPNISDIDSLPTYDGLHTYPYSPLAAAITDTDTNIPLVDVSEFPSSGLIDIGSEVINYSSVDTLNNILQLISVNQRGFYGTVAQSHSVDGYAQDGYVIVDGYVIPRYVTWEPPGATVILSNNEDLNDKIYSVQCRFDISYPNDDTYPYTSQDGYHQVVSNLLTTDLSGSDAFNRDFPLLDVSGWRRTDMSKLLAGECVGSYIGGRQYCVDSDNGVGMALTGSLSVQNSAIQRQFYQLALTGEKVILLQKQWTGITCDHYLASSEQQYDRCPKCYGSGKFITGYEQYINTMSNGDFRDNGGKIYCRFSPADEDVKMQEAGLESEAIFDVWTLTIPTIRDRDILVRFEPNSDVEEYRYEVLSVNRSRSTLSLEGAQKMRVQRIRKYDPIYQIKIMKVTGTRPVLLATSSTSSRGIPAHFHTVLINENITNVNQITQTTSVVSAHSHECIAGRITPVLAHSHILTLP